MAEFPRTNCLAKAGHAQLVTVDAGTILDSGLYADFKM